MKQESRGDRSNHMLQARASNQAALNRREALTLLGSAIAVVAGCSSDDTPVGTTDAGGPPLPVEAGDAPAAVGWASGGTQKLAATYPDPFTENLGSTCTITCRETIGPCFATTVVRRDVSEGLPGLPLRLVLRVVDESCAPVTGATVDIWHTRNTGTYSGDNNGLDAAGTPGGFLATIPRPPGDGGGPGGANGGPTGEELSAACTAGDVDAQTHHYFRGTQTTDDTGRVYFDTCYPGWYVGRAIHIHVIVRRETQESVVSQLYFDEGLTAEIFSTHPDYAPRGQPDTVNSKDGFFTGLDHMLSVARQPDGAMLAWKTIALRNSADEPSCGTDGFARPPTPVAP